MKIRCTQCGAEVPIEEDASFIQCPYCDTHLFVEVDQTVLHYLIQPNLKEKSIGPSLMRHLAGMELDQPVDIEKSVIVYFPFWQLETGQERKIIIPAATTTIEGLSQVSIPVGDLKFFDPEKIPSGQITPPETLLEGAVNQYKNLGLKDEVKRSALIHLPLFMVRYKYQGMEYEAAVDAVSGNVYADVYPPLPVHEKDSFFGMMMIATMVIFIIEGTALKGFFSTVIAYTLTGVPLYYGIRALLKARGW